MATPILTLYVVLRMCYFLTLKGESSLLLYRLEIHLQNIEKGNDWTTTTHLVTRMKIQKLMSSLFYLILKP